MSESGPLFVDDGELRLPPGTVVAGAVVQGEMARGGMAIVYRARREDGSMAALKVGTAEAAVRSGTEQRYRNEERMGARLRHPNIVRPIAVGRLDAPEGFEGRMFLLTPYVDAPSLSHFMMYHADGVPLDQLWSIGRQLADALAAMHDVGIVHRDIKPDNVLVGDDGHVHVIDFGIAFSLGDVDGEERSKELTLAGDAPGTPLYMSPQQAMHKPVSRSFDIYALGVLLYEMCCGSAPHEHLPPREIAAARSDEKSKPLSLTIMAPRVPVSLVNLIERCMAYDPEQRPTAAELVAFFEPEAPEARTTAAGPEDAEERTTAPELRIVSPSEREPSDPTMLMRRPPVVAEGARRAGDETMVRLVRDAVDMPSVRRVHDDLAKVDECIVVPKAQALAALGLEEKARARRGATSSAASSGAAEASFERAGQDETQRRRRRGAYVALGLFVLLVVGGVVAFMSSRVSKTQEEGVVPASLVERDAEPEPKGEVSPERGLEPELPPRVPPEPTSPESVGEPEPVGEPESAAEPERPTARPHRPSQKRKPEPPKDPEQESSPNERPKGASPVKPRVSVDELRAKAKKLFRAGQFDDCMALAKDTRDAEVVRITSMCKRRKAREEDSP